MWDIDSIATRLSELGVITKQVGGGFGGRLICCTRRRDDGNLGGNSLWVANASGTILLATWTPRYYVVPENTDLIKLIQSCLALQSTAIYSVPTQLITEFGLSEVSKEDAEGLA